MCGSTRRGQPATLHRWQAGTFHPCSARWRSCGVTTFGGAGVTEGRFLWCRKATKNHLRAAAFDLHTISGLGLCPLVGFEHAAVTRKIVGAHEREAFLLSLPNGGFAPCEELLIVKGNVVFNEAISHSGWLL